MFAWDQIFRIKYTITSHTSMDHKFSNMKHSSFNLRCTAILSQSSAHDLWTGNYT